MTDNLTKNSRKADFDNEEPPQKKRKSDKEETSKSLDKKPDDAPASSKLDGSEKPVATKLKTEATSLDNQKPDDAAGSSKPRSEEPPVKKIKKLKPGTTRSKCLCGPGDDQPATSQLVEDHDATIRIAAWRLQKFQSPIQVKRDESIHHDHFEPLEFHGHWDNVGEATFENTGKTAVVRFQREEQPYLIGGPLHEDVYLFEQLHFHWSDDDNAGCEHIFEDKQYSMEVHAVHYNKKYSTFKEAADKPDGLAVVGIFLEATDNADNPCFTKLTKAVQDIIKVNTSTSVAPDCLTWIKEEALCKDYYTYQGSLTTEPYLESVTWILYPTPIHVSKHQVAHFRELKSTPCEKVKILNNVRPIQTPPPDKKPDIFFARSHRRKTDD